MRTLNDKSNRNLVEGDTVRVLSNMEKGTVVGFMPSNSSRPVVVKYQKEGKTKYTSCGPNDVQLESPYCLEPLPDIAPALMDSENPIRLPDGSILSVRKMVSESGGRPNRRGTPSTVHQSIITRLPHLLSI